MLSPGDLIIFAGQDLSVSGFPDKDEDEIVGLVVSREQEEDPDPWKEVAGSGNPMF